MVIVLRLWLLAIALLITLTHNISLTSASTDDSKHNHNTSDVVNSLIIKAQQSVQDGEYETAMKVYEEAIFVKNITHIKLYNQFSVLLMKTIQNYTYSEKILNMALLIGTESNATDDINDMNQLSLVYCYMGMCHGFLNNSIQSKLMFEQSIRMNRSVSIKTSYNGLGLLLRDHFQDYANAITMFEKVLELDSTNRNACFDISAVLLRSNHQFTLEKSQELFYKIIKVLGNDFMLYNNFGMMIFNRYRAWRHARAIFVKSLSFNTSDSIRSNALFNLAMIDNHNKNYTSAVTFLKQAIDLNPVHINWYLKLANLLIKEFANYHEAAQFYIDALKIESTSAQLWQKLSEILKQDRISFDEIYTLIDKTNNFHIMSRFGAILVEQTTKHAAARSLLLKCVSIDPTWSNVWYYLGFAQILLKQYSEAITSLNKSIQLYPYWSAYHILGTAYSEMCGESSKAQNMFQKAIELAPDSLSRGDSSNLALCHLKLGLILEKRDNQNLTQKLKAMRHFEHSISIDPKSYPLARVRYAIGLISHGFDIDSAIEIIKQGLKTNPNDDRLLNTLARMQIMTHKTDHNTTKIFQTAIYKLNTTHARIYLEYAKYLFYNQLQTNHDNKIVQEIETMLYKAMQLFPGHGNLTNFKDQSYHQLVLLKMQTMDNNNESFKYQHLLQLYQQGIDDIPNSCLLHVGKAYLLQNHHFKQYNQSATLYQTAIQLPASNNHEENTLRKVNAMLNLASLLIDHVQYRTRYRQNYTQYLIEQGCRDLVINGVNGAIFFLLKNEWVGNFESTMAKFTNSYAIDVDKSLIHETLGLYYESLNKYHQSSMQFIMSIHRNDENNNKNDLIMVSHWKIGKISSRYLNNSITTAQAMQHFSIALDQSSRVPTLWKSYQLSELYYDFGYFLNTRMNDVWNATKYYLKSIELNSLNIKARQQLDETIEENQHTFSQFDKCALCLGVMIEPFQSIHKNNCTHRFHQNCIDKWYQKKQEKSCPLCREPQG